MLCVINTENTELTEMAEDLTSQIIGAAIEVHRKLGPGMLESAYEACMAEELARRGLRFRRQHLVPVAYKGTIVKRGFRVDLFVEDKVMVELKAVCRVERIHAAQLLSYLRLSGCKVGLLINFNVRQLKDGIDRILNGTPDPSVCSVFSVLRRPN